MGDGERARRPARIRRAVGALLFVAGCVSMAVCGVLSSKQQPRPDSILSEGGAPWFGRVKTLQVDADGALYIALDNHHILRCTEARPTVFYFGYEARSAYQFAVEQDVMQLAHGGFLFQYDLKGRLLRRDAVPRDGTAALADCVSVTYRDTEYRIERRGLLEEVWQYDADGARLCYRRLAWPLAWQMALSFGVGTAGLLLALWGAGRHGRRALPHCRKGEGA